MQLIAWDAQGESSIYKQSGSCNVLRLTGNKERDGGGYLLGLSQTAQWNTLEFRSALSFELRSLAHFQDRFSANHTRTNCVDGNAVRRQFDGQHPRKHADACLRRGVMSYSRASKHTRGRTHVDNPSGCSL